MEPAKGVGLIPRGSLPQTNMADDGVVELLLELSLSVLDAVPRVCFLATDAHRGLHEGRFQFCDRLQYKLYLLCFRSGWQSSPTFSTAGTPPTVEKDQNVELANVRAMCLRPALVL